MSGDAFAEEEEAVAAADSRRVAESNLSIALLRPRRSAKVSEEDLLFSKPGGGGCNFGSRVEVAAEAEEEEEEEEEDG